MGSADGNSRQVGRRGHGADWPHVRRGGRVVQKIEGYAFPVVPQPPPAMPNMSNETWSYTYDAAGRLESATEIPSAPRVYTYDARGNRNVTAVDEQDRATQVGAPGQPDYTFYTYDAHGNVATRIVGGTTHTYTWDGEGSLLGVAGTTPGTITYDVDAKGRRVGKRVNGALERQWMYDGQLRIVAEVVHTPVVRYRVYGYVPERHLPVLMLEKVSGAETQYRIYGDHLGSLRAVVRVSDGKAIQTMRHGPWGEVEDDSVANTFSRVPFGFAGGIYDEVTGLVRFGAREYDARTGRWLSKDEARFGGGENFFEYAGGDPVNRVDLNGRNPFWPLVPPDGYYECMRDKRGSGILGVLGCFFPAGPEPKPEPEPAPAPNPEADGEPEGSSAPSGGMCYANGAPDENDCAEVHGRCRGSCARKWLGKMKRWDQSMQFYRCIERCMAANGCR